MAEGHTQEGRGVGDGEAERLATRLNDLLFRAENSVPEKAFRDSSEEDYQFYSGEQDSEEVLAELEALKRPNTTYNEVKPKVDLLIGLGAQMKQSPELAPVGQEDGAVIELLGHTHKHYARKLSLNDKFQDCFEHMVKCGLSYLHFYVSNENPFKPEIKSIRIPGRFVHKDPTSTEYDLSDCRHLFTDKWVTDEDLEVMGYDKIAVPTSSSTFWNMPSYFDQMTERHRIVESWFRRPDKVVWFINPFTGKPEWLLPAQFREYNKMLMDGFDTVEGSIQIKEGLSHKNGWRYNVHWAIMAGGKVMENGLSPFQHSYFPYILFGAYKNEDKNSWFGAITMMKDPQRGTNTIRRQLTHLLQTAPRGILMHEVGAIIDVEEYERRSADPTYHMPLNKGALGKVKFSDQPQISPIYQYLDGVNTQGMKDASGVQDPMMGVQTYSREPGVTQQQRMEAGIAVLYILFNNYYKSKLQATKVLISMIQLYCTAPEVIRITGEGGNQLMEINSQLNPQVEGFNDVTIAEYDLEYEESVESESMRSSTLRMLTEFAQNNPGLIPPTVFLDYTNVPFSTKQIVKQYNETMQQAQAVMSEREMRVQEVEAEAKMIMALAKAEADKNKPSGGSEDGGAK